LTTTSTSVITPVHNGANFIAQAIVSVLPQLQANDEWLIINDHSADDTCRIVKSFRDPRIHLFRSQDRGISVARNVGLKKAQGEYISFLDHDDMWPQGRHAAMRARLDNKPSIHAVVGRLRIKFEPEAVGIEGYEALDRRHLPDACIGAGLFRHDMVQRAGGFAEDMFYAEDIDFINKLKESGMQVELMDIDGLVYRRHGTNVTNNKKAIQKDFIEAVRRKLARARTHTASS
jgi:glycosyltransferase involved in cell wall biosynthesis